MPEHNIFRGGKVHVMAEMCATCIFKPHARPVPGARVAELVRATRDEEAATVPCHHTLYTGAEEEKHAICKGWYDRFADRDWILRLAKSMGVIEMYNPEEEEDLDGNYC